MMSGVSLETCWAIKKHWNNKFYYTVPPCWLFLYDLTLFLLDLTPCHWEIVFRCVDGKTVLSKSRGAIIQWRSYTSEKRVAQLHHREKAQGPPPLLTMTIVIWNFGTGFSNRRLQNTNEQRTSSTHTDKGLKINQFKCQLHTQIYFYLR